MEPARETVQVEVYLVDGKAKVIRGGTITWKGLEERVPGKSENGEKKLSLASLPPPFLFGTRRSVGAELARGHVRDSFLPFASVQGRQETFIRCGEESSS